MNAVLPPDYREDAQEGFLRQVLYHLRVAQPGMKLDAKQLSEVFDEVPFRVGSRFFSRST